jgi:hypothetical protein
MSLGSHRALLAAAGGGAMPDEDWEALITTTVSSNTSSVTLTSAGSAKAWTEFQDLIVFSSARETTGGTGNGGIECRLNAASSTYRIQYQFAQGSVGSHTGYAIRETNSGARLDYASRDGTAADEYGVSVATLADINSSRWKTVVNMGGIDANGVGVCGSHTSMWENTAAVTSIRLSPSSGANFMPGSRFDVYGIRVAA